MKRNAMELFIHSPNGVPEQRRLAENPKRNNYLWLDNEPARRSHCLSNQTRPTTMTTTAINHLNQKPPSPPPGRMRAMVLLPSKDSFVSVSVQLVGYLSCRVCVSADNLSTTAADLVFLPRIMVGYPIVLQNQTLVRNTEINSSLDAPTDLFGNWTRRRGKRPT